ncbi:site-specific integrase [Gloeocapsopsis crepidinum LEGE 06123]|uniref:Site-specific integrase n=1 Tax=Gloeocapsopsis crepidinum LEGE 06123 TaxID=588587 RepID=A0ABR9V067_9CHRO|nr:site-specific integrase [Gloeocapsopsis crepidinum]MBE9193210.1 site-specific integrase [Gloeocapsopsis crepidinum LEGE 06123]
MVATKPDFKHLSVMVMRTKYGEMYQLRLNSKLGRKTIGLGSDKIQALNLALLVDEEISQCIAKLQPVDLNALKQLVHEKQEEIKAKKIGGLRLVEKDDLQILWNKYVAFHISTGAWTETYILTTIKTVTSLIEKCPIQKLECKSDLVQWIFSDLSRTTQTSKERFKLIVAAIDWNSKQGNIPRHWGIEYRDLLSTIKNKSRDKSEDEGIDIFSVSEVYQILEALKLNTYSRFKNTHSQYYKYVYFCWLTGCRPSEAVALKWENIDLVRNKLKFVEGQINASGKIVKKQGTKTEACRVFPINDELKSLLTSIPHRKSYVFLGKLGNPISQQALNGVWRSLLTSMGIRYRVPYQLRHTMISYSLLQFYEAQ